MDTIIVEYGFLGILVLLTFFSFLIGVHKMLQVVISCSFIMLIVLGRSGFLSYISYYIASTPGMDFIYFSASDMVGFIQSADTTTSLMIFVGLLIYAIHYANSGLSISPSLFSSKLTQLALIPLAILSMLLCLTVSIVGVDVFSVAFLQNVAKTFGTTSIIYKAVLFLPIGILLQGLITLLLLFQRQQERAVSTFDDL